MMNLQDLLERGVPELLAKRVIVLGGERGAALLEEFERTGKVHDREGGLVVEKITPVPPPAETKTVQPTEGEEEE